VSELDGVPRLSEVPRPTTNPRREKPHRPFDPDAQDDEPGDERDDESDDESDDEKRKSDGARELGTDDESVLTEEQKRKRAEGREIAPPDDDESGQILDVTA